MLTSPPPFSKEVSICCMFWYWGRLLLLMPLIPLGLLGGRRTPACPSAYGTDMLRESPCLVIMSSIFWFSPTSLSLCGVIVPEGWRLSPTLALLLLLLFFELAESTDSLRRFLAEPFTELPIFLGSFDWGVRPTRFSVLSFIFLISSLLAEACSSVVPLICSEISSSCPPVSVYKTEMG